MNAAALKSWVKARENPVSDLVYRFAKGVTGFAMPSIPGVHRVLYELHWAIKNGLAAIYQAMVLGLRDYVNKNGFHNVVLGLSGGIDSAIVAAMSVESMPQERVTTGAPASTTASNEAGAKDNTKFTKKGLFVLSSTFSTRAAASSGFFHVPWSEPIPPLFDTAAASAVLVSTGAWRMGTFSLFTSIEYQVC